MKFLSLKRGVTRHDPVEAATPSQTADPDAPPPAGMRRLGAVGAAAIAVALATGLAMAGQRQPVALTAVPDPRGTESVSMRRLPVPELLIGPGDDNAPFIRQIMAAGRARSLAPALSLPTAPARSTIGRLSGLTEGRLLTTPVNGRPTSSFGMRLHPILHYWKLHTGQDWSAACGTPVGAARAGVVVSTGWAGGNGRQVKIDHSTINGRRVVTTYNHLSAVAVAVGQRVDVLDGVGWVGNTGYSTGCHLHFEVIVEGQFTDPMPWLNGRATVVDLAHAQYTQAPTESPDPEGRTPTEGITMGPPPLLPTVTPSTPAAPHHTPSRSLSPPSVAPSGTSSPSVTPSLAEEEPQASDEPTPAPSKDASPSPEPSLPVSESPSPSASPSMTAIPTPSHTEPGGSPTVQTTEASRG